MKKDFSIEHEFVDFIPRQLKERTLYISIEFATATHKCFPDYALSSAIKVWYKTGTCGCF